MSGSSLSRDRLRDNNNSNSIDEIDDAGSDMVPGPDPDELTIGGANDEGSIHNDFVARNDNDYESHSAADSNDDVESLVFMDDNANKNPGEEGLCETVQNAGLDNRNNEDKQNPVVTNLNKQRNDAGKPVQCLMIKSVL